MGLFLDLTCKGTQTLLTLISVVVSSATLLVAIYIPRKIMVDQQFSSLIAQYRSTEMGFAIYCLFDFYKEDCRCNPERIGDEYKKRFDKEIKNHKEGKEKIEPSKTLQFQRRLVAQFYWDLAKLYFESRFPSLSRKYLLQMVGENERQLISLVLQMSEANDERFVKPENIVEPPDDDVPMNQFLKRLYDKTGELI
jgi:hypothetical protein